MFFRLKSPAAWCIAVISQCQDWYYSLMFNDDEDVFLRILVVRLIFMYFLVFFLKV